MKKQFAALILALVPAFGFAAGTGVHLDEVDIDLIKPEGFGILESAESFPGAVGATVDFEDVGVKVFDPETQAGHPDFFQCLQLFLGERSRFALKGDLFRLIPGEKILLYPNFSKEERKRDFHFRWLFHPRFSFNSPIQRI